MPNLEMLRAVRILAGFIGTVVSSALGWVAFMVSRFETKGLVLPN
jgi:hypothetical protein